MIKKILCFVMVFLILDALLVGCKKVEEPVESDTVDGLSIPMTGLDLSEWTIVRPMGASKYLVSKVADFKRLLDEKTGSNVTLEDDYLKGGETADSSKKEILIGNTNREESTAAFEALSDQFTYTIHMVGNKIVIVAPTAELIGKALDYIVEIYASTSAGGGILSLPENMDYTPAAFGYTEIVEKGVPKYQVVYDKTASQSVFRSANEVLAAITKLSSRDATISQDWGTAPDAPSFIIGNTCYAYTKELASKTGYFGWTIEKKGDSIYMFATDSASVELMCDKMIERINAAIYFDGTKTVRMCNLESESGIAASWCEGIPSYNGGTLESIREYTKDYFRISIEKTSKESYDAYVNFLASNGYTLYSATTLDRNAYATYRSDKNMLHAYYLDATKEVRILVTSSENAGYYPTTPTADVEVTERKLTMMDIDYETHAKAYNGMSFVYTLADGSYVIIDGGYTTEAKPLYDYLVANNKRADGKVLIRAWISTHLHGDHYECFNEFASKYAADVTLEYFVAQFDYELCLRDSGVNSEVNKIEKNVPKFSGAKYIVPMVGQKMFFGDLQVDFFYTAEMLYPESTTDVNNHSIVFKVTYGGQTFLFPGDLMSVSMNNVIKHYGDSLKSDFVQAPHHGNGVYNNNVKKFYEKIAPTYVFLNTMKSKADEFVKTDANYIYSLLNNMNVKEYFVGDTSKDEEPLGYREFLLPFLGSDYIEREYEEGSYANDQDRISFNDFLANE